MPQADPAAEFDLLYAQGSELFKAFPEYQFKTVTALLVIIGWLVTSESAQKFIAQHAGIAMPATFMACGVLVCFKFVWIGGHYARMRLLHDRLVALAPAKGLTAASVDCLRLGPMLPLTYLVVNVLLCSATMVVVWLICHRVT